MTLFGMKKYEQAIDFVKRSLKLMKILGSPKANSFHNLGLIHLEIRDFDQALKYF